MKIGFIYITENAKNLAEKSKRLLEYEFSIEKEDFINEDKDENKEYCFRIFKFSEYKSDAKNIFENYDALIFIMATGIVVRSISRFIRDKFQDPAILVMDELGKNVISLLSGHMGGANELTEILARLLNSNPVITTATDINDKGAFDLIVKKIDGYVENFRDTSLKINSDILKDKKISVYIDIDFRQHLDKERLFNGFTLIDGVDEFFDDVDKFDESIIITDKKNLIDRSKNIDDIIMVIPRLNVLGVGCRKNTDETKFENLILSFIGSKNLSIFSFSTIGSIDIKKEEICIIRFAEKYNLSSKFFPAEKLREVEDRYEGSDFVKNTVGVSSVSAPVSDILSGGNVISEVYRNDGVTISIGRKK